MLRDLPAVLARGRAMAEARMLDEWAVMVSLGVAYDDGEGTDVEQFALLFITKARVKTLRGLAVREAEVGGRTSASVIREFHIPTVKGPVPAGAFAFPVSIHTTGDPTLADARLRLDGPAPGDQTTARRLQVSEVLT